MIKCLILALSLYFLGCSSSTSEENTQEKSKQKVKKMDFSKKLQEDINEFKAQKISKDTLENSLGRALFFDTNLSNSKQMSCASCHNPDFAYIDNRDNITQKMTSLGDDNKSIGRRNAPTLAYLDFKSVFLKDDGMGNFSGGMFWDGRAINPQDQAKHPFLDKTEMNLESLDVLIQRLKQNKVYENAFKILYEDFFTDHNKTFDLLAKAISVYEQSDDFSPYNSKYDKFLKGEYKLTQKQKKGKDIFFTSSCHTCHSSGEQKDNFTLNMYRNLGIEANKALNLLRKNESPDLGLYNVIKEEIQKGRFKTPTLRNIAITSPYMHNGVFKELKTVLKFYDKHSNPQRLINPETNKPWEAPEVSSISSLDEILITSEPQSDEDIDALYEFLKLLTDEKYEHLLK